MKKKECKYYKKQNQCECCTHKANTDIRPNKHRKMANYYEKRCLDEHCPFRKVL